MTSLLDAVPALPSTYTACTVWTARTCLLDALHESVEGVWIGSIEGLIQVRLLLHDLHQLLPADDRCAYGQTWQQKWTDTSSKADRPVIKSRTAMLR